ncbi:type II secretion system protein [Anaerobacillus alkaliphilus]|uniref:Type II secretion system protein n=1 Tax=Anaerobacillus alkaliphilus TaxID=1548597 RepID=A0A4V1LGJ5_9BACI|nr:type II secretion system F family protein [Anaerobacillus alkaliphilus]RXJ01908.1 type II secretion system protein [Anaerobacillus alkaliphilus]
MEQLLLFLILISSSLLFGALFKMLLFSKKKTNQRLEHYLNLETKEESQNKKEFTFALNLRLANEVLKKKLLRKTKNKNLELLIKSSGIPIKPDEFTAFRIIGALLIGLLLNLLLGNMLFLFLGIIIGYVLPVFWVKKKHAQRLRQFNEGLPDMIVTIIGSLRAGFSFQQALKSVVDESDSPIKDEMDIVIKEMQYGRTIEEALNELKERMPSDDLDLMIQAILIQRQVGGNLATILEKIVETIRDRTKIQQQIQTLTAQGRLSGMVIGFLPIILGVVIFLINPGYISSLFTNPIGLVLVGLGLFFGILGIIFIRKVTTIEV